MSDIFNFRRLGNYMMSDLRLCVAEYGLGMMLISLMGLVIYVGTVVMGLIFNGSWGGPTLHFRLPVFAFSMVVLAVTMPVKCYGRITEKRVGIHWLMIPASRFEKMLSMILVTVFLAPLACSLVYCGVDALLCGIDNTCGEPIVSTVADFRVSVMNVMPEMPQIEEFINAVTCPWLYVDDVIFVFLLFLLGAVVFKTGKTAKTIIAFVVFCSVSSAVVAMVMSGQLRDQEELLSMFVFRHVALVDTINDTLVNMALVAGIWFRIRTLKH